MFPSVLEVMPLVLQECVYYGLFRIISNYRGYDELVDSSTAMIFDLKTRNSLKDALFNFTKLSPENKSKITELAYKQHHERILNNSMRIENLIQGMLIYSSTKLSELTYEK